MNRGDKLMALLAAGAAVAWLTTSDRDRRWRLPAPTRRERYGGDRPEIAQDRVLEERVRRAVAGVMGDSGAVIVSADSGMVVLSGEMPEASVDHLLQTVQDVRGVDRVENLLRPLPGSSGLVGMGGGARD